MKSILDKIGVLCVVIIIMICLPSLVHAQSLPDPGNADAPIDGGVSILIAAGVGYGVRKVKEHRKKKLEEAQKD